MKVCCMVQRSAWQGRAPGAQRCQHAAPRQRFAGAPGCAQQCRDLQDVPAAAAEAHLGAFTKQWVRP